MWEVAPLSSLPPSLPFRPDLHSFSQSYTFGTRPLLPLFPFRPSLSLIFSDQPLLSRFRFFLTFRPDPSTSPSLPANHTLAPSVQTKPLHLVSLSCHSKSHAPSLPSQTPSPSLSFLITFIHSLPLKFHILIPLLDIRKFYRRSSLPVRSLPPPPLPIFSLPSCETPFPPCTCRRRLYLNTLTTVDIATRDAVVHYHHYHYHQE